MINQRTLRDVSLMVALALPAQNTSNLSAAIDTTEKNPGRLDEVELLIELPATPSLADGQTVTLTVQDSADGVTYAVNTEVPALVATGAGGVGSAAKSYQGKLPNSLRRYVKLAQAASATAGNNTAISGSLSFVF